MLNARQNRLRNPLLAGSSGQRLVITLCPVSAAKVSGWMNFCAAIGHDYANFKSLLLQARAPLPPAAL
jgi:hypothetical protein